ncbi:MAG: EAL domain-containing protein [Erysipelotrichaceae bacterium]|nr:EAL domain-containing protein [Erysipelotrichaceae bacterium]
MIKSKQIQRPQLVLVVDDQEINRDVLGAILEDDYEVIYACDGKEALDIMREKAEKLSIVLLDLMMPVMNGFEVLETVQSDDLLKRIPIIVLTAEKNAELQALQMGAADFITKPFDMHEVILARVGRIIELSEGRQLISAAEYDRLTMLYNRNFFFEYADRIYRYHPELKMDAIILNIEQFHLINDVNGRDFGDEILKTIGMEIRSFLSETEGIASRFDADIFYIYCVKQDDYQKLLERFQNCVNNLSENVSIHLRMGVKPWREDVEPVTMFDRARTACNMVRGNYQNPLMIYNDSMRTKEIFNQRLLNDLNAAVEEKQLMVYYQPKYNIQCDPPKLSSAEALIRWKHPELGMISPGDFIPLFEGNGLINVVDNYVWKEAARQVGEWKNKYGFHLPVSVNLSRADIFDPQLIEKLVNLIKNNDLKYKDLKLEVTESAYTDNAKKLLELISNLRTLGFEVEMDDFGSGYSSLNMLSEMPIDVLKMDMKFVRNIEENETDFLLVKLILDIAKYLNLHVVAEGVEKEGQLNLLKDAGCDLVQGFYFSKPLPPEEFEKLIEKEISIERNEN